jgi:hypothetical protein
MHQEGVSRADENRGGVEPEFADHVRFRTAWSQAEYRGNVCIEV